MANYNRIKPALYNEIDSYAAQWLRNLIAAGHIAPGDVDERSITDITPDDLRGYTQFHTFAGIGVWSYALRMAGWEDDRPVWTGSCPCQPFSSAGKGAGFDDERHLWPFWHHLIRVCRPGVVFGEQVASKDGLEWFDLVQSDLEGEGYAVGAQDRCSAGVGAPHIRQRLYFVATEALGLANAEGFGGGPGLRGDGPAQFGRHLVGDSRGAFIMGDAAGSRGYRRECREVSGATGCHEGATSNERHGHPATCSGSVSLLGNTSPPGLPLRQCPALVGEGRREEGRAAQQSSGPFGRLADDHDAERRADGPGGDFCDGQEAGRHEGPGYAGPGCGDGELAYACGTRVRDPRCIANVGAQGGSEGEGLQRQRLWNDSRHGGDGLSLREPEPGPVNGPWRDADWLFCRDGKWRPVESGTFPLAHGASQRVGRLRAYGNAIDAENARDFISTFIEAATAGFDLALAADLEDDEVLI